MTFVVMASSEQELQRMLDVDWIILQQMAVRC